MTNGGHPPKKSPPLSRKSATKAPKRRKTRTEAKTRSRLDTLLQG